MIGLPATARQTWNDIKTVGLPAFQEARQYIERIITGHVDPAEVQAKARKAATLMEGRKAAALRAKRPAAMLNMRGDATVVRRRSGLLVPPKYKDQ